MTPTQPPRITSCTIGPYPSGLMDFQMPKVTATFDDGRVVDLFTFYPDELSFTEREFVGLTEEEGKRRKYTKDVAYLRSPGPAAGGPVAATRALHNRLGS